MEGCGGMVAVVQGLKDAGLAVTLLSQRGPACGKSVLAGFIGSPTPTQACQTMTDMATETVVKDRPQDILYKSSYQLAHCQPLVSPERLQQYPLQGFQQYRNSTSRYPDEEAFIDSLRKYPISPVRSRSADLIERMLSYTQNKNGARYSNTRSAKSLPSKEAVKRLRSDEIPTRDTGMTTNDVKPNFGYKRDVELIPVPTSNRKSRYDNQIGMYDYLKSSHKDKKLKGSEVRYLTNVKQCLRERLQQLRDEDPATICPKIQNRYSQHRKQYHRAETSQKSQKVNYCKKEEKCPNCRESMTQDALQNEIQLSPSTSRERKESKVNRSLSSFKYSKACFCDRPAPCDCGTQPSRSILKPKLSPEYLNVLEANKRKQCISICEYECNKAEDLYLGKLRETIYNWLQELPVYANFSTTDVMKREEIVNKLFDSLGQFQKDDTYFEKVENEVKRYLKILPMWRPENKGDQESFENQFAFNLIQKIKDLTETNEFKDKVLKWIESIPFTRNSVDKGKIAEDLIEKFKSITQTLPFNDKKYKEALKSEIVSTLHRLPIEFTDSKTTVMNNIADKLIEKLHLLPLEQPSSSNQSDIKNLVLDWIKNVPQISDTLNLNSDDSILVNDLIMKLNNLQNQDIDNKQEQMNDEIINWLNSIEIKKNCQIDHKMKNLLTGQLISKLSDSLQEYRKQKKIHDIVQIWFEDMPSKLGVNFVDNQEELDILATKLQDMQGAENYESQQNAMRQEIVKWLQNLQKKLGRYVDSEIEENIVNKLVNMIKDEFNIQDNATENSLITQNIWKWLESQPEFKHDNSLQYRDMVIELSEKLQAIKDKHGEFNEYEVKTEISKWFEKLSQERAIQIDPHKRVKLQDKLLSSINPMKRRKNWKKPHNIQEIVSKEVNDIINYSVIPPSENLEQVKDEIIQVITQDLNNMHSFPNNQLLLKTIDILKQATNLPEIQIKSLANALIKKVKEATLSNIGEIIQEEPLIIDVDSKDKFKSKVEDILKPLPLKDKQQVIDIVTDNLVKNYEGFKTGKGFEEIYEILNKANVSEAEAQEITNKILDMSNQFRNDVIDTTYKSPTYGSEESLWMQKQMFMQRLEREITDFMEKVLNESSSSNKDTTSGGILISEAIEGSLNNYNKFKLPPFKTSTPTKQDSGRDMNLENQYMNQIKELIKKWITCLEIEHTVDESFKNAMAHDIATDIIDRQRYIQLSKTKRSSHDEIEHLKYQIFKWTSKLPNQIDLTSKIPEIKTLIKSLDTFKIPNLIHEMKKTDKIGDSGSSSEYAGKILIQDNSKFVEENIYGAIWNWFNEISKLKPRSSEDKHIIDEIFVALSKKLTKLLILDKDTIIPDVENLCKDEIVSHITNLRHHLENTKEVTEHTASELIDYLKSLEFFDDIFKRVDEIPIEAADRSRKKDAIKKAVQNWCQKLPLKTGKTYEDTKDIIDNLAEAVSRYLLITDMENINTFMDDILSNLKKLPLQFNGEDSKCLPDFTERLIDTLKGVLNGSEKYYSNKQDDSGVQKPVLKKAAEVMYDNIQNWCENLPLDLGIINEDEVQQVNMMKQTLAGKLLKKVGELNLDPEIFHDDYLYEDVLKDEIEKILNSLPKTKQFEEVLPSLKENLVKDLLQAKEEMKNEMAGFVYKQQLKDAVSKTLSSLGLSITEEVSLEVLKNILADAFISLHYIADDEDLKKKFKEKIFNEVNKFCKDYLKQNPSTQLNIHELNQELYKALKKVPTPKDESMRREVEHIRIKDLVTDWFKDLPLEETPSRAQENKIVSILAKRLHEIGNEAELNPDMDVDETMNNEISKWLKKFKLKSQGETSTEPAKKSLINKLKATKKSRKFNESTLRRSINYTDLTSGLDDNHYPSSSLSADDRAHLQRIRDRTSIDRTTLKPDDKKDASVSPVPIATGMQTEDKRVTENYLFQKDSQNASIQTLSREPEPPATITPQVIVKEYYWNSQSSPIGEQHSGSILSYMQSPGAQPTVSVQQKTNISPQETPHITTASQTIPLPVSKATITQEASVGSVIKSRIQNDNIEISTQTRPKEIAQQQQLSNETNVESEIGQYYPDDYVQLNLKKKTEIKSCPPCRGRAVLSGVLGTSPEAGTSKAFQETRSTLQKMDQEINEKTDMFRQNPENWESYECKNSLDDRDNLNQPCFRRFICPNPTRDIECPKRRKRSQPSCTCRNPVLTKCAIHPHPPCQYSGYSNKSCYVSKKLCPKCWDGFCPHPSYLYFTQD